MRAANPADTAPVAVLVKMFPKLSETFVLEEVLGLERAGLPLRLYALAAASDSVAHDAVARVRAPLTVLPRGQWAATLLRHLQCLAASPWRYACALRLAARRGGAAWGQLWHAGWLAGELQAHGVRHLHAHFISEPGDMAELVACLSGLPFSLSAHAKDIYLSRPADLRRKLGAARFAVTCTDFNCQTLRALAPAAAVQRMYHGIDHRLFHPAQRGAATLLPQLLSVGRLREKKGLDTLVHACALLRARGLAFTCRIVGYGEQQARLAALVQALGLDGVVVLAGKLTRDKVIAHYARAAVYVQPSRVAADGDRDGIPNVLLEAMAMGVPVVATRVSGIPELVRHGHSGLLVPPDDPAALAQAIAQQLADTTAAQAMAQAARATVLQHFDNDRNLQLVLGLLAATPACQADVATAEPAA